MFRKNSDVQVANEQGDTPKKKHKHLKAIVGVLSVLLVGLIIGVVYTSLTFWEQEYDDDGSWVKYGYDCFGSLRKENSYYASGDIEQSLEYDSKGRTIKNSLYTENGKIVYRYEYKYNASGILIREDARDIRGHRVYEYDESGRDKKTTNYFWNSGDEISDYTEYEYDTSGKKIILTNINTMAPFIIPTAFFINMRNMNTIRQTIGSNMLYMMRAGLSKSAMSMNMTHLVEERKLSFIIQTAPFTGMRNLNMMLQATKREIANIIPMVPFIGIL